MTPEERHAVYWSLEMLGLVEPNGEMRNGQAVRAITPLYEHLHEHAPEVLDEMLRLGAPWPRPPADAV